MRRVLLVVISFGIVTSIISVNHPPAEARSPFAKCAIMKFKDEYKRSKAVFVGKVINVDRDGDKKVFEFAVKKFWKGIDGKKVKVSVHENRRYQAQFKIDRSYLVFAKESDKGEIWDGRCSRSRDLEGYREAVEEDLRKLGKGKTCIDLEN